MIPIKTPDEIKVMTEGGMKLTKIRDTLIKKIQAGVKPLHLDILAKKLISEAGGSPSFMTVAGYKWATCFSINEGVVHGIPGEDPLKEGDVVGLDIGLLYKGLHTDTSETKFLNNQEPITKNQIKTEKFLNTGKLALEKAIKQVQPGNRIGHISQAIQTTVEGAGYNVVHALVGHGVGRQLHEPPQIPGLVTKPIEKTPILKPGMVLAIEVIYNMGKGEIVYKNKDGWTLVTKDGSISGLFEHTVLVSAKGPVILT